MSGHFGKKKKAFTRLSCIFILILLLLNFIQSPTVINAAVDVKFRFDEHLCGAATWTAGAPAAPFAILPCPGVDSDSTGFVKLLANTVKLEDGTWAERTIETHPMWQVDGWILGTYSLSRRSIVLAAGDHLVGQVGLMEGANSGRVKFTILYDQNPIEPGGETLLFEREDIYDGRLIDFDIDLSPFTGQSGDILLKVNAQGATSQDWAVWKQVRIQQTISTSTFTQTRTATTTRTATPTPSPSPSATPTNTPTFTGTVTATITPTPTPTQITTEPPPPVATKKPCACYESQVLDTFFSGNDGFAVGNLISGQGLVLLTVVDEKALGDNGLFTMMDPNARVLRSFERRFTPNDVIAVGDVWGDENEDEILVAIDEDHKVYVYNSFGELLETKNIPYTRYDILVVGNVIDDLVSPGDEIIFASDEKDNFVIYPRSGNGVTIDLDWDFDGNSVPGIKSDAHSDALTIGNVLGNAVEEILFIEQKGDDSILYIYSAAGTLYARTKVRYTKFDTLASGDVMGNDFDEVIIGIDEDRAIYLLNAFTGILKIHHGRVTAVDVMAVADISGDGKEDIFLAVDEDSKIYLYLQE